MKLVYDRKVEKYFTDWNACVKAVGAKDARTLKKRVDQLEAAEVFGDFLSLGLGEPHPLQNFENIPFCWSVSVTRNRRLILYFDPADGQDIRSAKSARVKGVVDYHGQKHNWYLP